MEREKKLKMLLSEYAADVFIVAKTGLFYKIFPEETLTSKEDKCLKIRKLNRYLQF